MYRSELAQAAHEAILSYIRDKHDENKLKDAIDKLDEASMLELSMNGDSHLIDILHLPFEITNNQPAEKCRVMLHLLLKKATGLGSQVLISLLTQPNEAGFTPLHQAANSNSIEVVTFFLSELKEIVSLEGYRTALSALAKGHKPSCELKKSYAKQINALLQDERQKVDLSLRTITGNNNHQSQTSKRLPQASFFHNNRHSDPNGLSQKYLPSNSPAANF